MEAYDCTAWQFDHDSGSLRVHLRFNGRSSVAVGGLAIEHAIRREVDGGCVTYVGRLVRDRDMVLSLDRRNGTLWIILPPRDMRPHQAVVITRHGIERLRTAMVKAKTRSRNRSNSNGHG